MHEYYSTPAAGIKESRALTSVIHYHTSNHPLLKTPTWTPNVANWSDFVAYMTENAARESPAAPRPAIVPAALVGGARNKNAVSEINVALVEVVGVALDDIRERMAVGGRSGLPDADSPGWCGAIFNNWENGRTETTLHRDTVIKWLSKNGSLRYGGTDINDDSLRYYMSEVHGWLDVSESVEIVTDNFATPGGAGVAIRHDPLPSFLVAVPLIPAFKPTDVVSTQAAGCKMWGNVLKMLEHGVSGRQAMPKTGFDPAAMVAMPRCRPGVAPVAELIDGAPANWHDLEVDEPAATAAKASGAGRRKKRPAITDEWMERLGLTEKGFILSNLPNLQLIIENDPRTRGVVGRNAFTGEVVLRSTPGRKEGAGVQLAGPDWTVRDAINGDLWSDAHDDMLRAMLEAPEDEGGYDLRVTDRDLSAAVHLAALGNEFHPVRNYLTGLVWDETPRVASLFVQYLGSDDDAYHREAARLMLVGAVARAFEPGMKIDESVILEGLQGKRKTTFIETLAVNWYGELDAAMDDAKGCVEQMQSCWIVELGELTGLAKADVRRVKSFLSRHTDKARLAYARRAREFPRACIFIGSTNDQAYLKDPTGGRRFLPVACKIAGSIDIERLRDDIGQLWAEAVFLYRQMRDAQPAGRLPLWLSDEAARETARTLQASRTIDTADDVLAGQIEEWLIKNNKDRVCLREVWEEALCRDLDAYTNSWASALGQIMRSLPDWEAAGTRESFEGYGQQRAFKRVATP